MKKRPAAQARHYYRLYVGSSTNHPAELMGGWNLALETGRKIHLESIKQFRTYAGLFEGVPKDIDFFVDSWMNRAKEEFSVAETAPVLIEPTIFYGYMRSDHTGTGPGKTAWRALPEITTMACFDSYDTARDHKHFFSSMVMVWFQSHWGIPTDPVLITKIKFVDWKDLAWDWTP